MNIHEFASIVRNQFLPSFGPITAEELFYCWAHGMTVMAAEEYIAASRDANIFEFRFT